MRLIICPRAEGFRLLSHYLSLSPPPCLSPGLSSHLSCYDKWDSAMNYIVYTNYFIGRQRRLLNTRQITHTYTARHSSMCLQVEHDLWPYPKSSVFSVETMRFAQLSFNCRSCCKCNNVARRRNCSSLA